MKNKNMIRNFILIVGLLLVGGLVMGIQSSEFSEWVRVVDLVEGDYIAVPDYETGGVKYERIASIEEHEPGRVYDMEIEGTHNFIANDIIAHNTNRFFQYRAVFTSNSTETPVLEEVSVTYASTPFEGDQGGEFAQLVIWDDSDDSTVYANYTKFYANYTNATSGASVNGSGVWCTWRQNKTGSWVDAINMSFNSTSLIYELVADGGYICNSTECHRGGMPVGDYSFNVSCFDSSTGFTNLTVADGVNVSEYATSLSLTNDTTKSVGEQVMFYANYSADTMLVGGVGLNRSEIGRVVWNTTDLGTLLYSVAFFDCENKGKKDCIVLGYRFNIQAFYPNGSSLWTAGSLTDEIDYLAVGDLDSDGFENDIAFGDTSNLRVFNESGDQVWIDTNNGLFAEIGDFDKEGQKNDIIFGGSTGIIFAFNTSDGQSWSQLWNLTLAGRTYPIYDLEIADINGDGYEDVVAVNYRDNEILVINNSGSLLWNATGGNYVKSLAIGDLDNSGIKNDVVSGSQYIGNLYAYNQSGQLEWNSGSGHTTEIEFADLDSDGYEDDIVYDARTSLEAIDQNGSSLWSFVTPIGSIRSIFAKDINGDGEIEIIAGGADGIIWVLNRSGSLLWSYNINQGGIGQTSQGYGKNKATDISDINADGIPDIAVASQNGYAHILQDVTCTANFNDSNSYNMTWNSSSNLWQLNRTFSTAASYDWNVSCEKGGYTTQLESSTLSVSSLNVSHSPALPYANWTRVIVELEDSGANCSLKYNKTGIWSSWFNMSWNASLGGFEVVADNGYLSGHMRSMPVGNYSYNVTCENYLGEEVSSLEEISVQEYGTTLVLANDTTKSVGEQVMFYANYSADTMLVGGVGLNRSEIGRVVWNTTDVDSDDQTYTIAFVDLDNDGKKDEIVLASGENTGGKYGTVYAFYSNGTQIASGSWPVSVGRYNYEIVVGDLDNDGYENEFVIVNQYDEYDIKVINETGDVIFDTFKGVQTISVVIIDLDHDGLKNDIVFGDHSGGVYAYNTSDGVNWDNKWNLSIGGGSRTVFEIKVGDLDRDGYEDDIAAVNYIGGNVFAINETGGVLWNLSSDIGTIAALSIGDLDRDGYRDEVIIANDGDIYAFVFNGTYGASYGTGDAIFSNADPIDRMHEIAFVDLDDDGYEDDFVVGDRGAPGRIWGFDNNSNYLWNYSLPATGADDVISSILVVDINGDGEDEIIVGGQSQAIFILNKTGSLLWDYTLNLGVLGAGGDGYPGSSPAIDTSDINNDGIPDIAVASADGYAHILQDVTCKAYFNDSNSYNMTWDSSLNKWQMNRTFATAGDYDWNVSCEKGGYVEQFDSSSIYVDDGAPRWSANETNLTATTSYGDSVYFNVTLNDSTPAYYVFSWYNGTAWVNDSAVGFSDGEEVSVVKTVNIHTDSGQINWTWYINDSYNGNLNQTDVWSVDVDNHIPEIDYTTGTEADGANVSQDWVFVNVSVTDDNEEAVVFNLFNSDSSLNASRVQLSELPDSQGSGNGINMGGNVLLMHMNNDSAYGENDTVVYDFSGEGNNGTGVFNGTGGMTASGKIGGGVYFDGDGDYVNVTVTESKNTISLWYKNATDSSWSYVVYNGTAYFINGILGTPDEYPLNISGSNVKIGINGTTYFNGSIDEVAIWNRTLSAEEIMNIYQTQASAHQHNFTSLSDGTYYYNVTVNDSAGNENSTATRVIGLDVTFPTIDYTTGTEADGANKSQDWVFVNVSVTENDEEAIVFNLFNSDNSLNASQMFPSELPDDGAVNSVFNMTGNVLLMHMNNDSDHCYDNETEILTRVEVECGLGDLEGNMEIIDEEKKKKERLQKRPTLPSLESISDNFNNYINVSVDSGDVGYALVAETANAPVSKTGVLRDIRVRNSVLSEYLGQGVPTPEISDADKCRTLTDISLKEVGACYTLTDISLKEVGACYNYSWKYFKDLEDEEVATLNQGTGELEWEKPGAYFEFDSPEFMYEIETDGGKLVVSPKHKVYSSSDEFREETSNLSSYNVIILPLKSSGLSSLSNLENELSNDSGLSCGILNQTIENMVSLLYNNSSVKSQSLVMNTLCSDLEYSDNLPFESPLGLDIMSNPCYVRNTSNLLFTFSSLRNLGFEGDAELDIVSTFGQVSSVLESCQNMCFSYGGIVGEDFVNVHSSTEHFKDLPDHDSCAFECQLSVTDFGVRNNEFVNLDSHEFGRDGEYKNLSDCLGDENSELRSENSEGKGMGEGSDLSSQFSLEQVTETYDRFENGGAIYFLDENNEPVKVRNIRKVTDYSGKIYDVDVGNDVVLVRRGESVALWSGNSENDSLVYDFSGSCYDNETRIMTSDGWKYFKDLDKMEEVATLNQESGELEWELPTEHKVFDSSGEMYRIGTDDGDLVVSEKHRVYSSGSLKNQGLVDFVMVSEFVEDEDVIFNFKHENETSDMNSFIFVEVSPEIFEMVDKNYIAVDELNYLLPDSQGKCFIFTSELVDDFFQGRSNDELKTHFKPIKESNSPKVIGFISPDSSFLEVCSIDSTTSLTTESLTSRGSYSEIPDTSVINDNFKLLTNCLTTLAKANSNSCLNSTGISSLITISCMGEGSNEEYINLSDFSLQPITDVYLDYLDEEEVYFLNANNEPVKVKSITKENYSGKIYDVDVGNDVVLVERDGLVVWSGNSNNGSVTGASWTSSGKLGAGAFEFDGNGGGDYITIGDSDSLSSPNDTRELTISAWVYPKQVDAYMGVVSTLSSLSSAGYFMGASAGAEFVCRINGTNYVIDSEIPTNEWINYVCLYNGTDIIGYKNGVYDGKTVAPNLDLNGSNGFIGQIYGGTEFNGTIDEVAIFNRSLSATEIEEMYNWSRTRHRHNFTSLSDGTYYYNVTVNDSAGNENSTATYGITLDDTAPVISVVSPQNASSYYTAVVDFNVSVVENIFSTEGCWFSLDGAGNVSMTEFNSSYFNWTKSDMTHGSHNVTFWCNDSLSNLGSATLLNFDIVLMDFTVSDVTVPSTVYANSTFIEINVSNLASPNATGVNVSCYIDGVIFDSKNLSLIEGNGYYITNCTLDTSAGLNRSLNVTVDPANAHPESNESNNDWTTYIDVLGLVDLDVWDQEDDSEDKAGWLSEVERLPGEMEYFFANYTMDNSSVIENATCNVTFSGGSEGGTYNLSYNDSASLYYYNRTFDYAGNYSWTINCSKTGFEFLSGTGVERVRIPLFNQTSLGVTTGKVTVNYDENVNLSVNLSSSFDVSNSGYNISEVWANVVMPNSTSLNYSLSGSPDGGWWNHTYSNLGILGTYNIDYFANLTNGFDVVKLVENNFSVENTSILIDVGSEANTTNVVNVGGTIRRYNGSDYTDIANNLFTIKLNSVLVSSDSYASTNFTNGTGDGNVNMSVENLRLNLTSEGNLVSYTDDYVTTGYTNDAESYNDVGWVSGHLFDINTMSGNVGNITYRFSAVTEFYNASAYMSTAGAEVGGGNDTIYYSLDNVTWVLLANTTSTAVTVGGVIPGVQGESEFYVRFGSDKTVGDNPVSSIEINYTNYNYSASGNYTSEIINLANVTYTTLKWDESLNGGTTKVQLRESDDGSSWDAWSSNYTSHLDNDITSFSKDYLQYKVWLGATNRSRTPIVQGVNISYFNASTNSTGGYNYNITIPADSLGSLDLEVEVVQNPTTGIVGLNSTLMDIWAETSIPYEVVKDYTSVSNYSVYANWTRDDTGELVNGTFDIIISNATMNTSQTCSGVSQCVASWVVPTNLSHGNYTVNISVHNESAYYRNASASFDDYLEEKNTTGTLYVVNKTIGDYSFGNKYPFYWNVTINNTGSASMPDLYVYDYVGARGSAIDSVVEVTPCSKLYPNEICNATMLITLKDNAAPGSYFISWRANWTDNDGSIAGGADYISYTDMYVIIVGNATMELSRYTENLTVQHNSSGNFSFFVNATGSNAVTGVGISFVEGNLTSSDYNLSSSWVSVLSINPIDSITAGDASSVSIKVDVPVQTAPGNYSGIVNVSAESGGSESLNLTVIVPTNGSWYLTPNTNFTYNYSYSLNTAGEIGNFTLTNLGNINMTMNVSYSPSGTYDYSALGTALFEENYNVSGLITNPSQVNVTKGENATITLYQKGDPSPRINVGIIIEFYNASATPTTFVIEDAWTIEEQDPNITGVWFLLDGVSGNIAEQSKNLTIKFRATDDIALNTSGATINLSGPGGDVQRDATAMNTTSGEYVLNNSEYVVLNYSGNYSPTTSGVYTVVARVLDKSGSSYVSDEYTFTSYGTTTVTLAQNYSSKTVGDVDLNNAAAIYVNYTINNSGLVTAYSPTLTFVKNSTIEIDTYVFSDLSSGSVDSHVIRMNVSKLTPAGVYNVTTTLTWTNPDTGTNTDSAVFSITVEENSSIAHSPSVIITGVDSGSTNSSVLQINNTGNTVLSSMNLDCYTGTLCNSMAVVFNSSNFQMGLNDSTTINVTLTAPTGLAAGNYVGTINVSATGFSDTIQIQAVVPVKKTWSLSPTSINTTKGAEISDDLQTVTINNTGNVNMTWNLGTTNSTLFTPNSSSLMVPLNTSMPFMINYTAPSEEGHYVAKITVTNADVAANPTQLNVTINMSVTALIVDIISPTASSPLENVTAGQNVSILANATYGATNITNGSTWNVSVGSGSCSGLNWTYSSSTNQWNLSCVAPSLPDGVIYNLTVELTNSYGTKDDTEDSAISYTDLTYPTFDITRNHVNLGGNINLEVNVTDNVAVENVTGVLTYPNSSTMNLSFTLSGGLYINNSFALGTAGEYLVNYTANDSTGNENSSVDWFEVYDKYYWNVSLVDYASAVVSNINISLKRPNTTTVLLINVTNASGKAMLNVNRRFYDLDAVVSVDEVVVKNVNFSNLTGNNISFNLHRLSGESVLGVITLYKPFIGLASNSTGLSNNIVDLTFNYSGYSYRDNGLGLSVIKCSVWNYTDRSCSGSWSLVGDYSDRDLDAQTIPGNSTGFNSVAYFLADNMCGNGACETAYGETTSTCSADCKEATDGGTTVISGGGGGGGSGGLSAADLAKIEDIVKSYLNIGGVNLETTSIYKELFAGEIGTVRIKLRNTRDVGTTISLEVTGEVQPLIFFEDNSIELGASEARDVIMKIVVPKVAKIGEYNGNLIISSKGEEGSIPVTIKILAPEGKLLDVKIQPLTTSVAPGEVLRLQTDILNLGKTKRVDVQFDLQLVDLKSGEIVTRAEESFAVETSISTVKNLTIPEYVPVGKYMIKAVAYYSNVELEGTMQASSIAYVNVQYNFFVRKLVGIPIWMYLSVLLLIGVAIGGYYFLRWKEFQKRRFKSKVELNKLPQASLHSGFVGMVAETGIRTFVDMDKLQMHTLIAGATGGGKTIAAQDIIEEALIKKKSVIVFDPTAQWTGFLRKCEDARMLKRYKYFGVKTKDAKSFNGTIQTIHDPYEVIDIKKYMDRPGEITIFNISHLTPKEMDIIVASTIEQIFRAEPEESQDLKTLIVYDEVHRLLPKFGGSGQGFVQLERGAREFRKWGVGLFLISQVLSDFIGEIKANIGTEVQMGTRYEGDLDRISMKYGDDVLKSVVKEPIGTGMVVNAEYNSGRPYFVSFRPILHSTKRLSNEELKKYEKYFVEIEDLEYQAVQLKGLKVDTMDLELEIKLSKAKIKSGQFQMADMYLESLRPKVEVQWKKVGKNPMHLVKKKLSRGDVIEGIKKAKIERAKYIKKNPQEKVSFDQEILDIKKSVGEEKKKGKNTSALEIKVKGLEERLKPFKGKISSKDSLGIKQELDALNKEVSDFVKQTRVGGLNKKIVQK